MRIYKPARTKEIGRGYFSYLTEAVGNLYNYYTINDFESNIMLYFDLWDIPGYGSGNIFDIAFEKQDHDDYKNNTYENIEDYGFLINHYDTEFALDLRIKTEKIINKHFRLNDSVKTLLHDRFLNYDLNKAISVHYRTTDIIGHHPIVDINNIFETADAEDFDHIFLATDSHVEYLKFKEKYGDKLLFFDRTASDDSEVFFRKNHSQEMAEEHIREMAFNAFALSKTKKLICTRSNVSAFSIMANSKLDYIVLT